MRKLIIIMMTSLIILGACSSESDESSTEDVLSQENEVESKEEKETNEDSENEEIPVLEQVEVSGSVMDTDLINFKELDDKKKAFIKHKDITEKRIYYGDYQVIALNDNETMLYDMKQKKTIWESEKELVSVNAHLEEDKIFFSSRNEYLSLDIATGDIVDSYPFIDHYEDYIQLNEKYISGSDTENFQITNRDTGDKVTIPLPEDEYYNTALAENALVTEKDGKITSYDNSNGEKLAEIELDGNGETYIGTSGNGDDLYVFNRPETLSYGYILQKMDAKTLEAEKKINLKNANMSPVVTNNAVYYLDEMEGNLVAIDLSLENELWRFDHVGDDYSYSLKAMIGDENGIHMMLNTHDLTQSVYLNLNYDQGDVLNFVEINYGFHNNNNEFYVEDGKAYIRADADNGNVFHVIDKENAHRPFP